MCRTLDPNTVSKAALRKAIAAPEPTDKVGAQIERSKGALLRAITRRARGDPEAARTEVEGLMDELQKILADLGGELSPRNSTQRQPLSVREPPTEAQRGPA
jgi:uncharacterized membrane protein YccC